MDALRQAIARWWGYNRFRLLQCEAIYAVFTGRDSVVVLPTFGSSRWLSSRPRACVRVSACRSSARQYDNSDLSWRTTWVTFLFTPTR
jgi:hypothetical protein